MRNELDDVLKHSDELPTLRGRRRERTKYNLWIIGGAGSCYRCCAVITPDEGWEMVLKRSEEWACYLCGEAKVSYHYVSHCANCYADDPGLPLHDEPVRRHHHKPV